MKVFFTGTYSGESADLERYKRLFDAIRNLGYDHVDDEVIHTTYEAFTQRMAAGREAQLANFHSKMQAIAQADICVVETTIHSFGSGFIVQKSLEMAKPTMVLYFEDNVPFFLSGVEDDKLLVRSYSDENYQDVLREAFEIAREKRDKRFNFFLSPKLLTYLEDTSKKQGVTKSKLIRDMIVRHMREHQE